MKLFEPNMGALQVARDVLLTPFGLDESRLLKALGSMFTHKVDYADLYFQFTKSEGWSLEEGIVKTGSFSIDQGVGVRAVSGDKTAFSYSDEISEGALMDAIRDVDEDLSGQIEDLMFVFDNLADVDDRGIQALLREVSSDVLVLALKGSDEAIREKIFRNMSKRAAELLRDDLEAKGPVRVSEVESAQKEILTIARRMAESGEIVLGGKGGEEMI